LRTAAVGSAVAIVALAGLVTYDASLDRLSSSPADQGVNWDLAIGNINLSDYSPEDIARLANDPRIAGVAAAAAPQGRSQVNGLDVSLAGLDTISGGVGPRTVEGRAVRSTGEIALGTITAARLHLHLGERVTVVQNGRTREVTFVGTVLLNSGISPTMQIGDGGVVSIDQVRELSPGQPVTFLLATVKPGVSIDDTIHDLEADWGRNVARPVRAGDVVNLERVQGIPQSLGAGLAVAATVFFAVALVVSVRERRFDLGILRAIGATRRQVALALTWQAVWLYGAAAIVAVPLGVAAGRVLWQRIADDMGVLAGPVVPAGRVALVALAGLVVVAAVVLVPARSATRESPSAALRTE
jgi:ABC-type antimicrobial peptide transport system permease subunit